VADILTFGANNESADFTFETLDQNNNFQEIRITKKATNDIFTLKSSLVGDYNAQNIVGITVLLLQIFGTEKTTRLIQGDAFLRLSTPGRLQNIPNTLGLQIFVDYAHTPDALENVLKTLQKLKPANASLICVFGCGGDRDITKRPLMGEISSRIADVTIITSDNPRTENPEVIIAQIKTGTAGASSLVRDTLERASAISQSIATAKPGDIILIAGKGHEAYQEIDGVRHPFSDVYVVQEFLTQVGLQDKV
jgi:UDP-N-acetylmuramoyl-L-alanyl-D-glutamate--2,6-diaminopimelate ligase